MSILTTGSINAGWQDRHVHSPFNFWRTFAVRGIFAGANAAKCQSGWDCAGDISIARVLDVDKARTVMVIKRSMNPGFAGIDNPLYYLDHTLMLFGDAKGFVGDIVRELSDGGGH